MYVDDLGLTTNDPGEMQTMLNKLRTYAEKKGLTVNTAKSEMVWCFQCVINGVVVHFISKSVSPLLAESVHVRWCGASREGQVQIFGHAA